MNPVTKNGLEHYFGVILVKISNSMLCLRQQGGGDCDKINEWINLLCLKMK